MKNKRGLLVRPSTRQAAARPVFLTGLLSVLLMITYIFTVKTYEPIRNISLTGGILVYPLTFLIIAYISKYYGFKEARKSIYISTSLYLLFLLIITLLIIPKASITTAGYNAVIQYLFANDYMTIGDTKIFYPLLGQFLGLAGAYVVSHLLYSTIYNAIHNYTVDYLAMSLSLFIAAIIDRIVFIPLLFLKNLIDGNNTFNYILKCLTSEFIVTIGMCLVVVILYVIIVAIKNAIEKKKHQI